MSDRIRKIVFLSRHERALLVFSILGEKTVIKKNIYILNDNQAILLEPIAIDGCNNDRMANAGGGGGRGY